MTLLDFESGIIFGKSGNWLDFDPKGFSKAPDEISTWTVDNTAQLTFQLKKSQNFVLSLELYPYLADGKIISQSLWIFLEGRFINCHVIKDPVEITIPMYREMLNSRSNRISFAIPDAKSPNELGLGDDLRKLGLAFVRARLK
jgi:hypothetical protein